MSIDLNLNQTTCKIFDYQQKYSTSHFYCNIRADRLESFNEIIQSYEVQKYAIDTIRKALIRKIAKPTDRVVILSTGDHGLGKTTSARLLSKAIFQSSKNEFEGDGLLLIHGENYKRIKGNDENGINIARSELSKSILEKLRRCPYSVILIDEIQKIHPMVLSVLEPYFEGLPMNNIQTNEAIYILTSDFEKEGVTSQKSYEDVIELINSYSKTIYKDYKIMNLVTDIAPFRTLTRNEVETSFTDKITEIFCKEMANMGLKELKLKDVKAIQNLLADKMDRLYKNENFRGIEKIVTTFVKSEIQEHLASNADHYRNDIVTEKGLFNRKWTDTHCIATIKLKSPTQLSITYNDITELHQGNILSYFTRK